jgi:hypothetical protein
MPSQAVCYRPFTVEAQVRSRASTCEIYDGQVPARLSRFSPVTTIPPMLQTRLVYMMLLSEGQTGEDYEQTKSKVLSEVEECRMGKRSICF